MRLQISEVSKAFGATPALHRACLEMEAGEIHALLGESGAGKSTLLKIVSGVYKPDSGSVFLDGTPFAPRSPLEARRAGISMVFRELNLAPHLTAEENLVLGSEPAGRGWIDRAHLRRMALVALEELHGGDIPLNAPAGLLPLSQQRRIELARAFLVEPKVLALDEPTRFLTPVDAQNLFAALRSLAARGAAILCTSRFLAESRTACTRYTVLRDGGTSETGRMADLTPRGPARNGATTLSSFSRHRGKTVLELKGATARGGPFEIDLTLHEGEIFGLAGLSGAGCTRTLRAIFGLDRLRSGEILLDGKPASRAKRSGGIAMLGCGDFENRHGGRHGGEVMLNRSIADNLMLPRLHGLGVLGFVSGKKQRMAALDWMEKLGVKVGGPAHLAGELSSGNRRRVAFGRLLHHRARVLLLDDPARGIDLAAKALVYKLIGELASEGKGILLTSSSLPELLGLCDTLGVMCRGRLVAVRPAARWTEPEILAAAAGNSVAAPLFPASSFPFL